MDHLLLLLLLLLWSSEPDEVRLVGKASHCGGTLEMKHVREWRPVDFYNWTLKKAAVVCEHLDCGSAVSVQERKSPRRLVWSIRPDCFQSGSKLGDCLRPLPSTTILNLTCLGKQTTAGLTCSEPVRLVGGASRCAGTLEVKHLGEWRPVIGSDGPLKAAGVFCEHLDCGSAVSMGPKKSSYRFVLTIKPDCFKLRSSLRECVEPSYSSSVLSVTCSERSDAVSLMCAAVSLQASRGQKLGRRENNKLVNFGVGAAEEGPAEEEGAHVISR
uniref:SRCR domain-containing protein n=1 Tax=Neolamprologus brichardi TaxID=32507 RepID=A0A3Q4IAN0_NEOBR